MQENENVGDVPVDAGSAGQQVVQESPSGQPQQQNNEWRDRILREKKDALARAKVAEEKMQAMQGQQLQSEGKKDEYIKHLESQLTNERETRLNDRANFAHRTLSERIISKASAMGCVDSDAILKLADVERVSMGDDLSIDDTSLTLMLDDMKKNRPYLFKTQVPPVADGTPVSTMQRLQDQSVKPEKEKNEKDMTQEEYEDHFRNGMRGILANDPA